MAVTASQLTRRFTSRDNAGSASSGEQSLGGFASTTLVPSGSLHALFGEVTGPQNAAGRTDFRCIAYVLEPTATSSMGSIKVWFARLDVRGATYAIGLDPLGVRDFRSQALAAEVPNPTTAPPGVAFSTPTSESAGLSVAGLSPAQGLAVWIRRICANSSQALPESNLLRIAGTS